MKSQNLLYKVVEHLPPFFSFSRMYNLPFLFFFLIFIYSEGKLATTTRDTY